MENIGNSATVRRRSKIMDFKDVEIDSLQHVDFNQARAWWQSLTADWKIAMVYNHNYNYNWLDNKITDFESQIKDIESADAADQELFFAECKAIKKFICSFYENSYRIEDLAPITYLENIENLYCKYIKVINMNSIRFLLNLKLAELHATDLDSLEVFRNLKKMEHLTVEGTKIRSLDGIEDLKRLRHLNAGMTRIQSLEPIRLLENLEYLSCFHTQVGNLEPTENLSKLKTLHCYSNGVSNIDALKNFENLENVNLSSTYITDFMPLKNNNRLKQISIKGMKAGNSNIDALKGLLPQVVIYT